MTKWARCNKVYDLFSEIWKFKEYKFENQVASTGNRLHYVLTAFDQLVIETTDYDSISLITILQYCIHWIWWHRLIFGLWVAMSLLSMKPTTKYVETMHSMSPCPLADSSSNLFSSEWVFAYFSCIWNWSLKSNFPNFTTETMHYTLLKYVEFTLKNCS